MERQDAKITARYSRIPDHSDLRGFSYRAPRNYQWQDDHKVAGTLQGPKRDQRDFVGKGPKGYRRSDERVYEEACEALMKHPSIDASDIEVKVREGMVTLKGSVPNRWMKRASEGVIEDISGVRDIQNNLGVD